jgi:hypothetical protein
VYIDLKFFTDFSMSLYSLSGTASCVFLQYSFLSFLLFLSPTSPNDHVPLPYFNSDLNNVEVFHYITRIFAQYSSCEFKRDIALTSGITFDNFPARFNICPTITGLYGRAVPSRSYE